MSRGHKATTFPFACPSLSYPSHFHLWVYSLTYFPHYPLIRCRRRVHRSTAHIQTAGTLFSYIPRSWPCYVAYICHCSVASWIFFSWLGNPMLFQTISCYNFIPFLHVVLACKITASNSAFLSHKTYTWLIPVSYICHLCPVRALHWLASHAARFVCLFSTHTWNGCSKSSSCNSPLVTVFIPPNVRLLLS